MVCSRLPICRSATSALFTGSKKPLPLLGGRPFGALPITMSPVALMVMPSAGPAGAATAGPEVGADVEGTVEGEADGRPRNTTAAPAVPAPTSTASTAPIRIAVFRLPDRRG